MNIRFRHPSFDLVKWPITSKVVAKTAPAVPAGWQTTPFSAAGFVEHMAHQQTQDTPKAAAHHQGYGDANYLSPVLHRLPKTLRYR